MLSNKSTTIKLPRKIENISQIEEWEKLWEEAENASCNIPQELTCDEIRAYFSFFMNRLPHKFAFTVLGELTELKKTPWDLLEDLFEKGDQGCMVGICCRSDLPDNMLKKCLSSQIADVLEHVVFHKKVTIQECESLLQRPLQESTRKAILRAINQKS